MGTTQRPAPGTLDYKAIFGLMHPGFFEQENIRSMPEDLIFEEMVTELDAGTHLPPIDCPREIVFGEYRGDPAQLKDAVASVSEHWLQFFGEDSRVYCALDGGRLASFCLLEDMCRYEGLRIGGPGCVGTVPEYRRRGIGLEMVRRATETLRNEGYDLSWIHYTGVGHWYAKLGYRTVLRWNRKGFLPGE